MSIKSGLCFVFTLGTVALGGCASANTRIGFPGLYWERGMSAFLGYAVVCLLVAVTVRVMIHTAKRREGGPLAGIVFLLMSAGGVLQLLPHAPTGFQFIPLLPWNYGGWMPFLISLACWCAVMLAALLMACPADAASVDDTPAVCSILLLLVMSADVPLSFCDCKHRGASEPVVNEKVESQRSAGAVRIDVRSDTMRYRDEVSEWKGRRKTAQETLVQLWSDRDKILAQLREVGVTSKADLKGNEAGRALVEELCELAGQIQQAEHGVTMIDTIIVGAESKLRRLERRRTLDVESVEDEEYESLSEMQRTLNEELRNVGDQSGVVSEMELDALLDEAVKPEAPRTLEQSNVNRQGTLPAVSGRRNRRGGQSSWGQAGIRD